MADEDDTIVAGGFAVFVDGRLVKIIGTRMPEWNMVGLQVDPRSEARASGSNPRVRPTGRRLCRGRNQRVRLPPNAPRRGYPLASAMDPSVRSAMASDRSTEPLRGGAKLVIAHLTAGLAVACSPSPRFLAGPVTSAPTTAPSAPSAHAAPGRFCPGATPDEGRLVEAIRVTHSARAAEVEELIVGSSKRAIRVDRDEGEDGRQVEVLRAQPGCRPVSDAVANDRIRRALDTFFTRKDARPHRGRRGMVVASIGCEERGELLVSLGLGLGIGEILRATYRVGAHAAVLVVEGAALAHVDLDGDGRRDVVWFAPNRHVAVRFTSRRKAIETTLEVPESEDTDYSFAAAPSLATSFALVRAYRGHTGSIALEERLRWDGTAFVAVERLDDDGFEGRYEAARVSELAVLDDPIAGGIGKLHSATVRCARVGAIDATCEQAFASAVGALTAGGVADAEEIVRAALGWRPCADASPAHGIAPTP